MTVFIAYQRGYPTTMKLFRSRKHAQRFVDARMWPRNYVIRARALR